MTVQKDSISLSDFLCVLGEFDPDIRGDLLLLSLDKTGTFANGRILAGSTPEIDYVNLAALDKSFSVPSCFGA